MAIDMTQGAPRKSMLRFALPLLAGNLFQQFYNVVDTIVVGRFVGRDALAAVGASFAIMTLVNSLLIGLSLGASVLFSQLYGAKDYPQLKKSIFLSSWFVFLFTALLSIVTFLLTTPILRLYQMPEETMRYAYDYLHCIFAGLIFTSMYNFSANLLRSLGDSKSPLYFLVIACLLNVVLDLYFVNVLHMEVFGVAIATVIAQAVSGLGCVVHTARKLSFLQFNRADCSYDHPLMKQIGHYSLLTAMQQSIMNFGIVLVQGLVNTFGATLMAGFAAGVKIDAFAYQPVQDFGNAFATYTAQNIGAKKNERIHEGLRSATILTAAFAAIISLVVFIFAKPLIGLFVQKDELEVIAIGVSYLRTEGSFYILIGFLFMFYGFYRGLGKSGMSIVLTIISLGARVLLAYVLSPIFGYEAIFWSIPIGWLLADVIGFVAWRKMRGNYPVKTATQEDHS